MSADDDLAALIRAEVTKQSNPPQLMVVDAVREDGLVNLKWGESILNGIPAQASYSPRAEGDVVLVLQHPAGWRVLDKIGAPAVPPSPDVVELSFGTSQPTGSWAQATAVWVSEGKLYVQTGVGPGGPGDPPTSSTPDPVTISPSFRQGYRSGRKDNQRFAQGASPEYPKAWTSIWGYGSRISDACAGKTVKSMKVRVARTSSYHGTSRKVRPRLYTHGYSSAPSSTPNLTSRWNGPGLGFGESQWATIPDSQAQALASGEARGIGVDAGVSNSTYLIYTEGCGEVRITFS